MTRPGDAFLAKIAVEFERESTSAAGQTRARTIAQGDGWTVQDVLCTCGPQDRPFEERHDRVSIAIVLAGSFQYRGADGRRGAGELMTPGSMLLGNAGRSFECGHEHGAGDRCLSFHYEPDVFERIAADSGASRPERAFSRLRLPASRENASLVARALAMRQAAGHGFATWEELSVAIASRAIGWANGIRGAIAGAPPSTVARITRAVRAIDDDPAAGLTLHTLAQQAGLSRYHFLRTFEQLTGMTPHQYVRRARLRVAAVRLAAEPERIVDVALDCGFGDVSNFNRAFRAEFGRSPRQFRRAGQIEKQVGG